jgi:predicted O-linked N-acetylglucosamine transferase (SPINDLY family)
MPIPDAPQQVEPSAARLLALGRERLRLGDSRGAAEALRQAVTADPAASDAWITLARAAAQSEGGPATGVRILDEAIAANASDLAVLEAKALMLNALGDAGALEAFLRAVLAQHPDAAWAHFYLGDLLSARDDPVCETHLRRALELAPRAVAGALALIQRLTVSFGGDEGLRLDEACALAEGLLGRPDLGPYHKKILDHVFRRVCHFQADAQLGDPLDLARLWAEAGLHTALLNLLSRVRTDADRLELLEQHRRWGRDRAAEAEQAPIRRPAPRAPAQKLRVGLLSADLRNHPVGYFAEPLFDHRDPSRTELYCYSFDPRPPDKLRTVLAAQTSGFRSIAGRSSREAAQIITDDNLDILVDLGGTTGHNRAEVMAWRPAPRQASWLGYVHSVGLPTIDGLICDRFNRPEDEALLAEPAWVLPGAYYALGASTFDGRHAIDPATPEKRLGVITFGTASNPTKYTPEALKTWAEITAAVPDARFAFVRRECGSAVFRRNVAAAFAAHGVSPDRLDFHLVESDHMALYNAIDISLDTFPATGGTTTIESLWMGVPVVSLKGPALFERLSWSILSHLNLADLAADDPDGYRATALTLALDGERRRELRATLRRRLRESPLGDGHGFARGFFGLLEDKAR